MSEYILARGNGRHIPQEDKIFGISNRAKKMIAEKGADKVINATIGSLLDDDGELVVLSSVDEVFKHLSPKDYADYAPIGGIAPFREAVQKAAFGSHKPEGFIEAVATPGGTGSLRNVISNYSDGGDKVLTSDWHWAPYNTIAGEIGRSIETFEFFTEDGRFNAEALNDKATELLAKQESLVIILNTPAHNPTGYSLTLEDWDKVIDELCEAAECGKAIALGIDAAYIDFAGDEEEYRRFCIAKTKEIADEFKRVCEYSSRGSWSNSAKVAQVILSRIYGDPGLLERVDRERAHYREMLIARGRAFEEEAKNVGLETVPFDAGFFISIPCDNPDEISAKLEKQGLFIVPLAKGLRVSVASISEEKCRKIPAMIKAAMED